MATNVGGDLLDLGARVPPSITAQANLADKTLVAIGGGLPTAGATLTGGVVVKDTPSGDYVTVKMAPGIYEVIAGGTVTAGNPVEIVAVTVTGNINGTATSISAMGVQNQSSTDVSIGRALTSGASGDTVLVNFSVLGVASGV